MHLTPQLLLNFSDTSSGFYQQKIYQHKTSSDLFSGHLTKPTNRPTFRVHSV